jgi:hypothetical protein
MPLPLAVQAIPYISTGLLALKNLFGGGSGAGESAQDFEELLRRVPQLRQMLDMQAGQAQRSEPLHRASVQMAMNLLPDFAFDAYEGRPTAQAGYQAPQTTRAMNRNPRRGY